MPPLWILRITYDAIKEHIQWVTVVWPVYVLENCDLEAWERKKILEKLALKLTSYLFLLPPFRHHDPGGL